MVMELNYTTKTRYDPVSPVPSNWDYQEGASSPTTANPAQEYQYQTKPTHFGDAVPYSVHPSAEESSSNRASKDLLPHRAWRPGIWVKLPLLGILALLGALGTAVGIVAILISSDGAIVGTWAGGVQPNTFIAIGAVLSNALLAFAFAQGLTQSYWRQSLGGTSLEDLHYSWNAGQSFLGASMAFFRRGHVHVNALALIGMTLSVARSPLNQAAAGVSNGLVIRNGTLDLHVAREIPDYYLATIGSSRLSGIARASALTQRFSTTMREYSARSPMKLEHDDCGDTCDLVLNTFGFCATCSSKTTSLSPRLETEPNESEPLFSIASDYWIQGNPYNSSVSNPAYAGLILSILYVTGVAAEVGNVTRVNQTCYLQPSVMAAPARLTRNNEIILNEHWGGDECVRPLNYTVPMAGWSPPPTTIGGFQYVLDDLYKSSASFTNKGSTESIDFYRVIGNQYVANDTQRYPTFLDPTDDVLDALREISFRTSLHAAVQSTAKSDSAATSIQTVPFKGSTMHAVYQTNRGAMAGGFVLAVIGIACVSLLYVRYWELGREMSMSPLEIARAFDAPLLRGVDGNAEVEDIVQDVGKSYVRYGEVTDGPRGQDSLRRLRFEDASLVERPEEGKTYY